VKSPGSVGLDPFGEFSCVTNSGEQSSPPANGAIAVRWEILARASGSGTGFADDNTYGTQGLARYWGASA
jgi:hypothetical protein